MAGHEGEQPAREPVVRKQPEHRPEEKPVEGEQQQRPDPCRDAERKREERDLHVVGDDGGRDDREVQRRRFGIADPFRPAPGAGARAGDHLIGQHFFGDGRALADREVSRRGRDREQQQRGEHKGPRIHHGGGQLAQDEPHDRHALPGVPAVQGVVAGAHHAL